jgi:polysaccharide pyruvyl transferase WcaK-like protein
MNYIISGAAFSGNKGASGMAEAIIQNLSARSPGCNFNLYTYYPRADERLNRYDNVRLLDGSPHAVVFNLVFALWAKFCILLRLPGCFYKRHGLVRAILEADYWLDASGISFADGREKFLIYNVMSIFPALLLGCRIVKMPQALGPFEGKVNRFFASFVLPRLELVCSRGEVTSGYLEGLGLQNYCYYPDAAFSLISGEGEREAAGRYVEFVDKRIVGVSPSQVVYGLCEKMGIDYLGVMSEVVDELAGRGYGVVVFAHSVRVCSVKRHNNDLPVLKDFRRRVGRDDVSFVEDELSAGELRELIGMFELLVGSRFHALISAICKRTPVVTIGWSHKYEEVLAEFGISDYVIDHKDLSVEGIMRLVDMAFEESGFIKGNIEGKLGGVAARLDELYGRLSE